MNTKIINFYIFKVFSESLRRFKNLFIFVELKAFLLHKQGSNKFFAIHQPLKRKKNFSGSIRTKGVEVLNGKQKKNFSREILVSCLAWFFCYIKIYQNNIVVCIIS